MGGFWEGWECWFFHSHCTAKKQNKKKGQKNKKKRIKNWESSGNSGLRTADPAPRESQISQRSPGGRGRKKKKEAGRGRKKKKTNQEEDKKHLEGKKKSDLKEKKKIEKKSKSKFKEKMFRKR